MTKLIFQFSPDCFLLPRGRWAVYPNTLRAPPELCLWNLDNGRAKFVHLFSFFLFPLLPLCFGVSLSLSATHILHTYAGHAVCKNYTLHGRWNRWVSCRSHIYENVLKWLGLNLSRPRGGQFKTYAFCTSIWLCRLTEEVSLFFLLFFFFLLQRCCTAAGLLLKSQRRF